MDPKLHAALKLMKISFANSKAYSLLQEELANDPEKRRKFYEEMYKAQEDIIRKETKSLEEMEKKYILK
jgi:hypothetical protein